MGSEAKKGTKARTKPTHKYMVCKIPRLQVKRSLRCREHKSQLLGPDCVPNFSAVSYSHVKELGCKPAKLQEDLRDLRIVTDSFFPLGKESFLCFQVD